MTAHTSSGSHRNLPELLAPAGSPAAFRAALAAGADAVYLSGKKFGARQSAVNFTEREIGEAVAAAHARGVRVYATMNTLIHDRELAGAADYLIRLYAGGVDAVLVQDAGLADLARQIVPDLPLHASTQMTIHSSAGVRWAAGRGLSRVVLARELSLEKVTEIAEKTRDTGVGLEIFAHGALCYAYSGQCLLSSYIGGRSGNRGMCAQPCRKPYTLVTGGTDEFGRPFRLRQRPLSCRYLLSPQDLCTYSHLAEIVQSPVVSLKIEGRMKSPEYVATVVSIYRRALDAIATGSWRPSPEDIRDLYLAFNRGFTSGHLFGSRGPALMGRDAPGNRGIVIGTVTDYEARTRVASVKTVGPFAPGPGDGLLIAFPGEETQESGFLLNNLPAPVKTGTIVFAVPHVVRPGALVYLTASRELDLRVRQIISRQDMLLSHPVSLDITAAVKDDGSLTLLGTVLNARSRKIKFRTGPKPAFVPARAHPLSRNELEKRLRKTGGTPFLVRNLELRYGGNMFAPPAVINAIRRKFLDLAGHLMASTCIPESEEVHAAEVARDSAITPLYKPSSRNRGPGKSRNLQLAVFVDSPASAGEAVRAGCGIIWYETASYRLQDCRGPEYRRTASELGEVLEICNTHNVSLGIKLSRVAGEDILDPVISSLPGLLMRGSAGVMTDEPGTAMSLRNRFPSLAVSGAAGLNIFNYKTARTNADLFSTLFLSPELSAEEIRILIHTARLYGQNTEFGLVVQGSGEAMISADDLSGVLLPVTARGEPGQGTFMGIGDGTGRIFPIRTDALCRTHIFNAAETCLIDYLPLIRESGIGIVAIDARFRPPAYAGSMTRIYREAIGAIEQEGPEREEGLAALKKAAKALSLGGITSGHFLRGLV